MSIFLDLKPISNLKTEEVEGNNESDEEPDVEDLVKYTFLILNSRLILSKN